MDRGICSICAGERVVHGKPCLCEDGTTIGELHGIRMECFSLESALSSLQAKHDRAIKALQFYAEQKHIRYGALETHGRDAGWPELLPPEDGAVARQALADGSQGEEG